ncbi:putative bifunctional diguanylate cyclase/phosphodiesterase [Oceanibacterium hippocampi]|uniref:Cyclic di-GMP phosphodiesterase Gmr n=1 Tax=Oceanibacterium hippocampi TaxID=745714 RepID=A0A1Y5TQ84_9PROT|nr:bifunctional diguanylate cyclase/phosphodiesterase [Oceanibacterium hippocampi]SLN69455.1 Cyclic di-GMP phosphodiesterase Gmr [Oceanibacterium hippocampi]
MLFSYVDSTRGSWRLEWTAGDLSPQIDLPEECPKAEGPWRRLVTADGASLVDARLCHLLAGKTVEDVLRFRLADGAVRLARLQAKPELNPESREVVRIIGSCDWIDAGHNDIALGITNQDRLSGLYNAGGFEQILRTMLNERANDAVPFTVFSLSLDCYSEVSLNFGKSIADLVLLEAARRLREAIGRDATVARLHTDQFAVILPDRCLNKARALAHSCIMALAPPFSVGEALLHVEPVMGASRFPQHGDAPRMLIRHAGLAQDHARQNRQPFAVFERDMERRVQHNLALLGDLRRALSAEGELNLVYQPVLGCEDRRVTHVEALLRWQHPHLGPIPPGDFVPILEQSSLIQPLTDWVLDRALDEIGPLWRSERIGVCINVSPQNLVGRDFVGTVREALARHNLPTDALGVELTETQLMAQDSLGPITETLRELTNAGIKVWLDDFGTGSSTLVRLQQLPATGLKIDRGFTQNLAENRRNRDLVRISVDIARLLGLEIIAEGVETKSDYDAVSVLGCDAGQGYFIARPMPVDKLVDFVRESAPEARGSDTRAPALAPAATGRAPLRSPQPRLN